MKSRNNLLKNFGLLSFLMSPFLFSNSAVSLNWPTDDQQIVDTIETANNADIDVSKLADKKSSDKAVKVLAAQLMAEHKSLNKMTADLCQKLKLKPASSDLSKAIKEDANNVLDNYQRYSGETFDRNYVDHEVTFHEAIISSFDKSLIPNAKNAELKDLLGKARIMLANHLEHAKSVEDTFYAPTVKP